MRVEAFKPSVHGFPFHNTFSWPGAFLGLGAPLSPSFGLCGGMSWVAMDRYLAGRRVPRDMEKPHIGAPVHLELMRRQADSLAHAGWARVREWQCLPDRGEPFGSPGLAELTRAEWPAIKRMLDDGIPVLLWVIQVAGPFANPSENVQVLAYRYETDRRSKRASLWVYHPGRPDNDSIRLTFNLTPASPLEATLAVRDKVRGFFAIPYDREPPLRLEPGSFAAGNAVALATDLEPVAAKGRDGRLHVLALDPKGRPVHVRRSADGSTTWEPVETDDDGASRATGTPAILTAGPRPRFLVRTTDGDIVEYRRRAGLGWARRDLTAGRGAGPAFRADGKLVPLIGPGRRASVLAMHSGLLVHHEWTWRRGWRAENVTRLLRLGESFWMEGELTACAIDKSQHVFGRGRQGALFHFQRTDNGPWSAENVTAAVGGWDGYHIAGDPVCAVGPDGASIHIFALSEAGELVHFQRFGEPKWRARNLTAERGPEGEGHTMASDLSVAIGAGATVHVFGRSAEAALIHYWGGPDGAWRADNLTDGRSAIDDGLRIQGVPRAVPGPDGVLRVFARLVTQLVLYQWTPTLEWAAESLSRERWSDDGLRIAADPIAFADEDGNPVVVVLDDDGALHYIGQPPDVLSGLVGVAAAAFETAVNPVLRLPGHFSHAVITPVRRAARRASLRSTRRSQARQEARARRHDDREAKRLRQLEAKAAREEKQRTLENARRAAREAQLRQREEERAAREQAGEEARLKAQQEEKARREEQEARRKAEQEEKARLAEEQARRKAEEEEKARRAEEEARRKAEEEEEARLEAEQEAERRTAAKEAKARQEAEEQAHRKAEEKERARLAEEEARRRAEEEEKTRLEEEAARRKAEEEEKTRLAEEQARRKAEEEEKARFAEEEARRKAEEEEKARLAEEEARRKAEEEEKARLAEEEARRKAEEEEKARLAEEEARRKAEEEEEARLDEEASARERAEAEAWAKAEADARRKAMEEEARARAATRSRRRASGRKRISPAIEGLPLLDDEASDGSKPTPAPASAQEQAGAVSSASRRERRRRQRALVDMEHILKLSERYAPVYYHSRDGSYTADGESEQDD